MTIRVTSVTPSPGINVIVPTGMPGPKGPPGAPGAPGSGVVVQGTYSGTNTPLPANPAGGDMWIINDPVPTSAPPRSVSEVAQPGDGMVWDGSFWTNTGPVQGPQGEVGSTGPVGPLGPPGIVMSPNPPPITTVLWADTDEEGFDPTTGGVNSVFAHNSPLEGISASPNVTVSLNFTSPSFGTATALPPGWAYLDDNEVLVPVGVYSFYLGWSAADQYWYGSIRGAYQLGTESAYVDINPGAPVLGQGEDASTWYGAASGTVVLHNTQGHDDSPWFSVALTHGQEASATNAMKWHFNVTRLGTIPS